MNAPSEDIKDILEGISSLALTYATDIFIGGLEATPDQQVAILDTGGFEPASGFVYEYPTVQIRVRGNKGQYTAAHELAQSIRDELHALTDETVNSCRYIAIWCMSDVMFLGWDDNHRPDFSVNFRIHRTQA